jgi:hypothetical protein
MARCPFMGDMDWVQLKNKAIASTKDTLEEHSLKQHTCSTTPTHQYQTKTGRPRKKVATRPNWSQMPTVRKAY